MNLENLESIKIINSSDGIMRSSLNALGERPSKFILCLAGTETSDIEGISAAGANSYMRRLTPALDAEALITGKTLTAPNLPVSPAGIVSPVVITSACLQLTNTDVDVVDCGSFVAPQSAHTHVSDIVGRSITTGNTLGLELASYLFEAGIKYGSAQIADLTGNLIFAECVPGGTTTALAVLSALGYAVKDKLSSSWVSGNHHQRWQVVAEGLNKANLNSKASGLDICAALGDPMQAFVAGAAFSASHKSVVVLAGGSQMLAVYALILAMKRQNLASCCLENISVITTKFVAFDKNADLAKVSKVINAPFAATNVDFNQSRHPGLRAYEDGHVKEGVGAGAAMALALLKGVSESALLAAVDQGYEQFVMSGCQNSTPRLYLSGL